MKEQILQYFYNNHDNQSSVIAKKFNLTLRFVDRIIDADLSQKQNAYKEPFVYVKQRKFIADKVLVLDENDEVLGRFKTYSACAKEMGIYPSHLTYIFESGDKRTIYHKKQNRTLTYIKL